MEQQHPLYSVDRETVDGLLAKKSPNDTDIVDLSRLILRYEGFPGAFDLQEDMKKTLDFWGISIQTLNKRARDIWESGYKPGSQLDGSVGSGFDANEATID